MLSSVGSGWSPAFHSQHKRGKKQRLMSQVIATKSPLQRHVTPLNGSRRCDDTSAHESRAVRTLTRGLDASRLLRPLPLPSAQHCVACAERAVALRGIAEHRDEFCVIRKAGRKRFGDWMSSVSARSSGEDQRVLQPTLPAPRAQPQPRP